MIRITLLALAAVAGSAQAAPQQAAPQNDYYYAQPDAVIATGVIVPARSEIFYVSGIPSNVAGGTQAQTADVLAKLGEVLKAHGYSYGDVVNMKVYLTGDPAKDGKMDFAGMNAAFKTVFGVAGEPNRPSRVTVQVAGLGLPGAMVEIELTAAKPAQ